MRPSPIRGSYPLALSALLCAAPAAGQEPACPPPPVSVGGRHNLGPCVNTPLDEAIPQVSPDGRTLYFTRRFAPQNAGGARDPDDVWVSRRTPEGGWSAAVNAGAPLNTPAPGWVLAVSADGETVLLANAADSTGRARRGVSLARRAGDGFSPAAPVVVRDFSTRSEWGHIHLAADGSAMVFSLVREDTRGGHDLYVSLREPDGSWGAPRSVGPEVNTAGDEITPFIAADGATLYFSTDGRGGEGGQDVFVTRRLDDGWTRWSEPRNLGAPVNTPGEDAGYVLPASGDWAYFHSSTGGSGGSDLFRVALPEAARPLPVALLRGEVRGAGGAPVAARVRYGAVEGPGTGGEAEAGAGGSFGTVLRGGALWCVSARAAGEGSAADTVDLRDAAAYRERVLELRLPGAGSETGGCAVPLPTLTFAVDSDRLRPEASAALDSLAVVLGRLGGSRLEVTGHTDHTGADSYNQSLSERRARAVVAYLAGRGVDPARLEARGYGESKPVTSNATAGGRAANRRVEVRLLGL